VDEFHVSQEEARTSFKFQVRSAACQEAGILQQSEFLGAKSLKFEYQLFQEASQLARL
jgi:hypothetical protein